MSILTVRVIKSFEYRTVKNLVLHDVDLPTMTTQQLIDQCREKIQVTAGFVPFRKSEFDTIKIHQLPHGAKTNNPIINLDHDEWILKPEQTLASAGVVHETELSLFKLEDYLRFKENPEMKW